MKLFSQFEHRGQKVAPISVFARRMISAIAVGCCVIAVVLFVGMAGLVFIGLMGIVLTPVVHRMLHKFHVE